MRAKTPRRASVCVLDERAPPGGVRAGIAHQLLVSTGNQLHTLWLPVRGGRRDVGHQGVRDAEQQLLAVLDHRHAVGRQPVGPQLADELRLHSTSGSPPRILRTHATSRGDGPGQGAQLHRELVPTLNTLLSTFHRAAGWRFVTHGAQ
ncbi:hypothetical protein ON010_g15693 [Phytophthora cinnamomi]|nr:hypothetical protein ON010_g15693 [Phytophthora cinnamomi]